MKKLLLFCTMLLCVFYNSQESDYTFFGKTADSNYYYFIKKNDDDSYSIIKSRDQTLNKAVTATIVEVSCENRQYRYLFIAEYNEDGSMGDSMIEPNGRRFSYPYSGSVNEKLLKYVCDGDDQFKITENDTLPKYFLELRRLAKESYIEVPEIDTKKDYSKSNTKIEQKAPEYKPDYYEPNNIKTGDFGCSNIIPKYNMSIDNELKVINKGMTDVVVKLMDIKTETAIRIAYIQKGDFFSIKNIPEGVYYLKEAYGDRWMQKNINGKCIGEFRDHAVYKKGKDKADFYIKKKYQSDGVLVTVPSYTLEIGITYTKGLPKNNYKSADISKEEFNK
ncbi:hypothetical protein JZ968_06655 [Riemerella anatipestifer]